ncbi:MAG TPA: hypothetical protein VGD88_05080 [Opitutaceae bacterium]
MDVTLEIFPSESRHKPGRARPEQRRHAERSPRQRTCDAGTSTDAGNDSIAILADGTKLISSVQRSMIACIRPGQPAESIATGIPNAASMAYDAKRNQLVILQNQQNAVTILQLQ